jgi:anthranilate synthase/aminodeoxychorismate synthase-like glutamine amidotransferase
MPRVLIIDNYDSFTFNLVQLLEELGARCTVVMNDRIDLDGVMRFDKDAVLISPGPCSPNEAGVSLQAIGALGGHTPLLGVCLGHQALAQAFGARIVRAERVMHGKTSPIEHDGRTLFEGLAHPFDATRYHSLVVEPASLPSCFEISAWTSEGEIMAIRHRESAMEGVQFHPESILTSSGRDLLDNWLGDVRRRARPPT